MRQNVERYMQDAGYPLRFRVTVTSDLFSSEFGLVNCETGSLNEKIKLLYAKWDDLENRCFGRSDFNMSSSEDNDQNETKNKNNSKRKKSFSIWLKDYQEFRYLTNSLQSVKMYSYEKVFINNRQEATHNAIKRFLGKKCHLLEFFKSFQEFIHSQQCERIRALQGTGNYQLQDNYQRFALADANYDTKRYLKCEPVCNPNLKAKPAKKKSATLNENKNIYMRTDNLTKILPLPINAGKKDNQKPSKMKHAFTEVYHNDRPFFIEIISRDSNRCAACQVEIPWKFSKPPFHLVLRHSERWSFKKDGNIINTN